MKVSGFNKKGSVKNSDWKIFLIQEISEMKTDISWIKRIFQSSPWMANSIYASHTDLELMVLFVRRIEFLSTSRIREFQFPNQRHQRSELL